MADTSGADVELPKAQVKRVLQAALSKMPGADADGKNLAISKDALLAFVESAKVLISYVSTTANDLTREGKRQTISAEDVIKAVEELEFAELVQPLKDYTEGYRKWNKERSQKRAETAKQAKKRKAEEAVAMGEGVDAAAAKGDGEGAATAKEGNENGAAAAEAGEKAQQDAGEEQEAGEEEGDGDGEATEQQQGQDEDHDMS